MLTSLKSAVLSLAIGLGTLTGAPAVASAEGIYFGMGIEDGAGYGDDAVQIQDGYTYRRNGRRYQSQNEFRRCTPERAAYKARRLGLNRARVIDVNRRTITVSGRAHGDRLQIVFGRAANCPVLDRYY